jgi:putative endonuclease
MGPRLREDDKHKRANVLRVHFGKPPLRTLYIGVTNDLRSRLELHRLGLGSKFVKRYSVHWLVYVESYENAEDAIRREKQLKRWNRDWKIRLIEEDNLEWKDLSHLIG